MFYLYFIFFFMVVGVAGQDCLLPLASSYCYLNTGVSFYESYVLSSIEGATHLDDPLRVYYWDEHALLLGIARDGFSVSSSSSWPGHVSEPDVGDTSATDSYGRPLFPALFISDVTDQDLTLRPPYSPGDWQNSGGVGLPPHDIWGTWKQGTGSGGYSLAADPTPYTYALPSGAILPALPWTNAHDEGRYANLFQVLVSWDLRRLTVDNQPLQEGRTYRFQVIVHDGDQNGGGGDAGQACVNFKILCPPSPPPSPSSSFSPSTSPTPKPSPSLSTSSSSSLSTSTSASVSESSSLSASTSLSSSASLSPSLSPSTSVSLSASISASLSASPSPSPSHVPPSSPSSTAEIAAGAVGTLGALFLLLLLAGLFIFLLVRRRRQLRLRQMQAVEMDTMNMEKLQDNPLHQPKHEPYRNPLYEDSLDP